MPSRTNPSYPRIKLGDRFERLTVIRRCPSDPQKWTCLCDCGNVKDILDRSLKPKHTRSCGCLHRERAIRLGENRRTHGHSTKLNGKQRLTSEYSAWRSLRRRCYEPGTKSYADYGAKGIIVCERWLNSFENFFADMGPKPTPQHTIERRDGKGNYDPDNCCWATRVEQNRNKSNNVYVTVNGVRRCIAEWSELSGINAATLNQRVRSKWPVDLLFIPPQLGRRINAVRK